MKSAIVWRDAARWICTAAVALAVGAGLAYAKLPQPPMDDAAKAKAEEGKAKAAEAARKEAEQLAKAQDRVSEDYKKGKGMKAVAATAPAPAAKKK
jgi:hypothetical protein